MNRLTLNILTIAGACLLSLSAAGQRTASVPMVRLVSDREAEATLPSSVDNSLQKFFPPVISQIGGSCAQASYIGYMFTYEFNRLLDRSGDKAENRFSYLYTWNFINDGQDVGSLGIDGLSLALLNGVMTEADFPKQTSVYSFTWASGYDKYLRSMRYQTKNFFTIDVSTKEGIDIARRYLCNHNEEGASSGGVLTFSSQAQGWKFNDSYSGPSETGYRSLLTKLGDDGGHAMTIVGYDDKVEFQAPDGTLSKGAFIVCNTWGTFSHDDGRYYLPYWFFLNEPSNTLLGKEITGVEVEYKEPRIVYKVGLKCDSRNDIAFRFGVSAKATDTKPLEEYTVPIAQYQGGDYPMQGQYGSDEIEFGLNFSPYEAKIADMDNPQFFLNVLKYKKGSKEGTGEMVSFAVYDYREDPDKPKVYVRNDVKGKTLENGSNIFGIMTKEPSKCSFSPVEWTNSDGQPVSAPLVFRTAKGKYAKVRFGTYDKSAGTISVKYVYSPDGSKDLKL